MKAGQSRDGVGCSRSKPTCLAIASLCDRSAASHIAFFGTQPTFTQVPPSAPGSSSATRAPCWAARNAPARPPEPPPRTTRSKSALMAPPYRSLRSAPPGLEGVGLVEERLEPRVGAADAVDDGPGPVEVPGPAFQRPAHRRRSDEDRKSVV